MVTEKVVGHGNDERMQITLIGWANTHDDRLHNKTSQNKTTETKLPKIGRTKPPNPTITQTLPYPYGGFISGRSVHSILGGFALNGLAFGDFNYTARWIY